MRRDYDDKEKVQTMDYWVKMAKEKKKLILFYGDEVLDLTYFCTQHPGGERAIQRFASQDVKDIFFKIHPHSRQAAEHLKRYRCGKLKKSQPQKPQSPQKQFQRRQSPEKTSQVSQISPIKKEIKQKSSQSPKKAEQKLKQSSSINKIQKKNTEKKIEKTIRLSSEEEEKIQKCQNFDEKKPQLLIPKFGSKFMCQSKESEKQTA